MGRQIVRVRAAPDDPDHLVDCRIDHVLRGAGIVALQDADGNPVIGIELRHALRRGRRREKRCTDHDQGRTANG